MSGFHGRLVTAATCGLHAVEHAVMRRWERPVVVLAYHRVTALRTDHHQLAVTPGHFRDQLRALTGQFPIVRFDEDWSSAPRPALAITMDDGYADNALEALPILEELRVPVTFFVATGNVGTAVPFWWDELDALLLDDGSFPARFALEDAGVARSWPTATPAERRAFHDEVHALLKRLGVARRAWWLEALRRWRGADPWSSAAHRSLSEDELRLLAASPWATLGAHTISHPALASLPPEEQRDEIVGSKRVLEELTGRTVSVFAYPFGAPTDYGWRARRICRDAGFRRAAANFPGHVHSTTDPFEIPRFLVRDWTGEELVSRLQDFLRA